MYIRVGKKWQSYLEYSMIVLGCLIMGFSFSVFLEPNKITTGGFSGIAMMISSLLKIVNINIQSSIIYLFLNVFLFIFAFKQLGKRFAIRAILGIIAYSLSMELFSKITIPYEYDNIIASIFGGLLTGFGVGFVIRFGGSTGGSDMIAVMIKQKHKNFQIGKIVVVVDAIVVILSILVYKEGFELLPYTIIALFVYSIATDIVIENYKQVRAYTIITAKPDELADKLMHTAVRGCTRINAKGMYSGKDLYTVVCLVSKQQIGLMHQIIVETDPAAFVYATSVTEVLGLWTPEKDIPKVDKNNSKTKTQNIEK